MIDLSLMFWVIIENKRLGNQAMHFIILPLSVFAKANKQVPTTIFRWFHNSFLSSTVVVQTLHPPPVTHLVKILITNDIPPNFNIFFQFLSDVAPEPYFQSIRLGTG